MKFFSSLSDPDPKLRVAEYYDCVSPWAKLSFQLQHISIACDFSIAYKGLFTTD